MKSVRQAWIELCTRPGELGAWTIQTRKERPRASGSCRLTFHTCSNKTSWYRDRGAYLGGLLRLHANLVLHPTRPQAKTWSVMATSGRV